MIRRILTFGGYFEEFMESLDDKTKRKIKEGLLMISTQQRLSVKFVKSIADGLFELRVLWNGNIYRVFFIFDEGNIVVLFNGFQKKTMKTPQKEINKALRIKKEYYDYKRQ